MGKTDSKRYVSKAVGADGYVPYTDQENKVWKILYDRQIKVLKGRACQEFIDGLKTLNLSKDKIPQPKDINEALSKVTGWGVETVDAVIPPGEFFELLANKKFPAASFIRTEEELDYLREPDIFHEIFGHCPLLTVPAYADFVENYGKIALTATAKQQKYLFRLFWFTIEFGLIKTSEGLRIMGGGILSSYQETLEALVAEQTGREDFAMEKALRTPYRIDMVQTHYFVLNNFDQLYDVLGKDILDHVDRAISLPDITPQNRPKKDGENVQLRN